MNTAGCTHTQKFRNGRRIAGIGTREELGVIRPLVTIGITLVRIRASFLLLQVCQRIEVIVLSASKVPSPSESFMEPLSP